MTQVKFSPKDARLVRENPGKSPDELLLLGISKKAYSKLLQQAAPETGVLQPLRVEPQPVKTVRRGPTPNHVVRLLNKATNVVVELGYRAAQSLSKESPNQYEIL